MFTYLEMQEFAYWYHNGFTNRKRPGDMQEAFDIWFENYGSKQIEESGFGKKKVCK